MKRVPGFTIIEIIIGLIITNILVVIIYFCLHAFQVHFSSFQSFQIQKENFINLNKTLEADVISAKSIYDHNGEIEINKLITNKAEKIKYYFLKDYVLRTNEILVDTFHVVSSNLLVEHISTTNYVSAFSYTSQIRKQVLYSRIQKNYSSSQLMDIENSNYGQ